MSLIIDKQTRDLINRLNKADQDILKLKAGINKILNKSTSLVATGSTSTGSSSSTSDPTAIHDNVAGEISAMTEKTVIVDADLLLLEDSEDSNNKKKVQMTNIVDSLKAEIDALVLDHDTLTNVSTSDHHVKYTDTEAIAAVEGEATLVLSGIVDIAGSMALIDSKLIKWGTGTDVDQYFDGMYMRWDNKGNSVWFKDMTTMFLDLRGVFYIRDDDDSNVILLSLNTSGRTLVIGLSADPITTTHTGDFNIAEGSLNIDDGITAPGTTSGKAKIYVDTADGDLKIKFGDGTVKTIVTDT